MRTVCSASSLLGLILSHSSFQGSPFLALWKDSEGSEIKIQQGALFLKNSAQGSRSLVAGRGWQNWRNVRTHGKQRGRAGLRLHQVHLEGHARVVVRVRAQQRVHRHLIRQPPALT